MPECNLYILKNQSHFEYNPSYTKRRAQNDWGKSVYSGSVKGVASTLDIGILLHTRTHTSDIEEKYTEYSQNWKNETRSYSTLLHKVSNDNFLDIIGIGKPAIKLILKDLQNQPSFIFIALRHLVKVHMDEESPVKKEDKSNVKKVIKAWLEWGVQKGIIDKI